MGAARGCGAAGAATRPATGVTGRDGPLVGAGAHWGAGRLGAGTPPAPEPSPRGTGARKTSPCPLEPGGRGRGDPRDRLGAAVAGPATAGTPRPATALCALARRAGAPAGPVARAGMGGDHPRRWDDVHLGRCDHRRQHRYRHRRLPRRQWRGYPGAVARQHPHVDGSNQHPLRADGVAGGKQCDHDCGARQHAGAGGGGRPVSAAGGGGRWEPHATESHPTGRVIPECRRGRSVCTSSTATCRC
jgi:hypothetical protein